MTVEDLINDPQDDFDPMRDYLAPGADPDCIYCHGRGYVSDWVPVPFGHGNCEMRTTCECLKEE